MPIFIDFKKTPIKDVQAIYNIRIEAVIIWLHPLYKSYFCKHITAAQEDSLNLFTEKLHRVKRYLLDTAATIFREQWNSLQFGLKAIGCISFIELRANYLHIINKIIAIAEGGYFDWI